MHRLVEVLRRFAVFSAVALWIGGFTFYTAVVIPVGARVLHSHLRQGMITQRVTNWLNVIGGGALLVLLCNLLAIRRTGKWAMRSAGFAWIIMALALGAMALLHLRMDRVIDPANPKLFDVSRFDSMHDLYLGIATAQWGMGVIHILILLWIWSPPLSPAPIAVH